MRCCVSLSLPVTTEVSLKATVRLVEAELSYIYTSPVKAMPKRRGGFGQMTSAGPIKTLHSCFLLSVRNLHFPLVVDEKMLIFYREVGRCLSIA